MLLPEFNFNRYNTTWFTCTHGVNGKFPTEITSTDILEGVNNELGKERVVIGIVNPCLLSNLHAVAGFTSYSCLNNGIIETLFNNEIGVLGNIRFIMDSSDLTFILDDLAVPDGLVYSTFFFTIDEVHAKPDETSQYKIIIDKVFNLRSTLSDVSSFCRKEK